MSEQCSDTGLMRAALIKLRDYDIYRSSGSVRQIAREGLGEQT